MAQSVDLAPSGEKPRLLLELSAYSWGPWTGVLVPESPLERCEGFVYGYIFWGKDSCPHMFSPIV